MSEENNHPKQSDLSLLWALSGSQIVAVGATENGDLTLSLLKKGKRTELLLSGDETGLTITEIVP